eukprot:TRINITY_DN6478_c0_g1_i1.p1 TRINITY_DN6478_c0_g1~~TRINITY_DN6478_c0_g1_i1.p1  ORF type:complete len:317 (+),score=66.86 TRINITY_DN6478_c0_g1_i1:31-951(+)
MFAYQGAYTDVYEVEPLTWPSIFKFFRRKTEDDEETDNESDGRSVCSFTDGSRARKKKKRRVPSMVKESGTYLIIPALKREEKESIFTLVLDLDETLAFGRQGPIVKRPHLDTFLKYVATIPSCEVIVWTAGIRSYAQRIIAAIDPDGVIKHCVYRHHKWYPTSPGSSYTKNLALTGRHPDRTLIIDNTPDCVMRNALNGIVCHDFVGGSANDVTLLALIDVLKDLLASEKPVPDFISNCPDLKLLPVVDSTGRRQSCYFLDEQRWGGPSIDSDDTKRKVNRDLPTHALLNPLNKKTTTYGAGGRK